MFCEYNDLWTILENMDSSEVGLLPEKYLEFVKENRKEGAESEIDPGVPIEEQELRDETKALLAILSLTYWSEGPEDRRELAEVLYRNEQLSEGKEPSPLTEEGYQDVLAVFDDWNEIFGPIPFWAESRGWEAQAD